MKFHEHIIRASIPELPFVLTREDLARGIADFARHPENYIEELSASSYADIYQQISLSPKYLSYLKGLPRK